MKNPLKLLRGMILLSTTMAACCGFVGTIHAQTPRPYPLHLRFDTPATALTDALPLGNGRLGASPFDGVDTDRILLNESSVWGGSRQQSDRPDAAQYLPEIRKLLLEGNNAEAEKLVNAHFTSLTKGSDAQAFGQYQELGSLMLHFDYGANAAAPVKGYERNLNLTHAVSECSFSKNGVTYTRETFVSAPDQAIVVRLRASKPGSLTFTAGLTRVVGAKTTAPDDRDLLMTGQTASGRHDETSLDGLKYVARLRVFPHGGSVKQDGDALRITAANEVILLVTGGTDYVGFSGRQTPDPAAAILADLDKLKTPDYAALYTRHQRDFTRLFDDMSLRMGDEARAFERDQLMTPVRLKAVSEGADDPAFAALYLQYGRYLLISSSRPGGLPANLQGIWAEGATTPWNGDWHMNVNIQMNYWMAETTGLSELTEPLFALTRSLVKPGSETAKKYYGADGWVVHIFTNPWGWTSPGQVASWGSTVTGSGWLCQHIWDHYLFTHDEAYLRQMYPVLRGASEFYLGMLIREPKHNWLVTAPSNSPENSFYLPDGQKASVAMGPAIDMEILRYLFHATAESAKILNTDAPLQAKLTDTAKDLAPIQIGPDGRIMEWLEPYREVEVHHRHVSHLWAAYPGDEIDLERTPALVAATAKSLDTRGDDATGWGLAYRLNLRARLGDGEHAYSLLRALWRPVAGEQAAALGGSYPNLFDVGPPFQIDGNFGGAAGIEEMLLQSDPGILRLLPALPKEWPAGEVHGLHTRTGDTVDLTWADGKLKTVRITANYASTLKIESQGKTTTLTTTKGSTYTLDAQLKEAR